MSTSHDSPAPLQADPVEHADPSRRRFLKADAAGSLLIGFTLPHAGRALAVTPAKPAAAAPFAPNAFLRIGADDRITVICGSAEMGQGVLTAIPMLVAEELDADWKRVSVEQAPADAAYNNPMFGMQATGGSTTVRAHWEPMRQAGAAARQMLVSAAAARWKADPADCRTEASHVIHVSGKRLSYGQLAADAAKLPVPAKPALKDPKQFRLLGKPTRRLDSAGKINGTARFGIDVELPGLMVAVMARAPQPGAKLLAADEAAARAVKGVKQVITLPSGVAVLATGYWAAKKGRDALQPRWDLGALSTLSSAGVSELLADGAAKADAVAVTKGQPAEPPAADSTAVSAVYEAPYLAHACMEPLNCTAWVRGDEVEIWAGTQSQGPAQGILSQVAQVAPGKVKIHTLLMGGGFGRRFAPDFVIDATLLSKLSGQPVKLIYTREDDMQAGYYRPASVARFDAQLDPQGRPRQMKVGVGSPSIMAASGFMKIPDNGVDEMALEGIADLPYDIANLRIAYGRREPGPQVWFWRSVGHSQNTFFLESFIDEMAAAAERDPLDFRLAMLANHPRHRAVLEAVADRSGWRLQRPAGRFRGIAVAESFGSYVAEVAEISIQADGSLKIHRVVAAVDCGMTVNPQTIERQIEGAIVYGLSAALYGRISFKDGRVEQGNFHDYPVLRMSEMPQVEVHILPSREAPGGIGEPGTPPIAAAVANAIFAASGKRLRRLPLDLASLRRA